MGKVLVNQALSGSLLLSLTNSVIVTYSGSRRLTLAQSWPLSISLRRSSAHKVLARLFMSQLHGASLSRPGAVRLVFYTICKWWNKSLRNVGSMRRCGFKRSEIYEVQQFQFLFHHILQLPFHHILRHLHFSRELFRPDLEIFLGSFTTL